MTEMFNCEALKTSFSCQQYSSAHKFTYPLQNVHYEPELDGKLLILFLGETNLF